ncbi:unnamed protein product [Bursaphelenchus xylophilus]|uniref:(pine wood nematode) hypothetical protein n=1 Tax=Bursaphelenchus xylophilus TaxID=6326 RepID=A0A1I7SCH1_BURXY|nr:unnamed protein product [Bursaphelenchus xylophilus]CAG9094106.1 unnamed protein product [Bursaphelenchus xylophilus]
MDEVPQLRIPTADLIEAYKVFDYFFMSINTVMFCFTAFAILKTPATYLSVYRYFLLHEIVWALLFDIMIFISIPVVHLPHICFTYIGMLGPALRAEESSYYALVLTTLCAGKAYSMFMCCFHRYILAHQHTDDHWWSGINHLLQYRFPWTPIMHYAIMITATASVWITVFFCSADPVSTTEHLAQSERNIARLVRQNPNMTCISGSANYKIILCIVVVILVSWGLGILIIISTLAYSLKTDDNPYQATIRLQWMLFRSLCAQLGATLVFMYFPLLIWFILGYFESPYEMTAGTIAISMLAMHSTVDCAMILAYVRPYRQTIKRFILGQKADTTVSVASKGAIKQKSSGNTIQHHFRGRAELSVDYWVVGPFDSSHLETDFQFGFPTSRFDEESIDIDRMEAPAAYLTLYRYFLLHEIIWAFLFDLMISLVIPVVDLPHICYQPSGVLGSALSHYGAHFFIYVLVLLLVGKAYSMFLCCFHRYVVAHQYTKYSFEAVRYLSQFKMPYTPIFYFAVFVASVSALWLPIYLYSNDPLLTTNSLLQENHKIQRLLAEYPSMTCQVLSDDYQYIILTPIVVLIFWGAGILFLLLSMAYVIKTDPKTYMSTLRLQFMLFRSLLAQLGATLFFMYFPLLIWLILSYNESRYAMAAGLVAMCLLAMHSCVDSLVIMLYVRPFRQAISQLFVRSQEESLSKSGRSAVAVALKQRRKCSSSVRVDRTFM